MSGSTFLRVLIGSAFLAGLASAQTCAVTFNSGTFGLFGIGPTSQAFTPSGGTPPYTFSYAPSAIPIPGFRVSNRPDVPNFFNASQTGTLIGIPQNTNATSETDYSTTIRVTDNVGCFADKAVTLRFSAVDIAGFIPNGYGVGDTLPPPPDKRSFHFTGVGGSGPYSYALTAGALPSGLTLNTATGDVTGNFTLDGSFNFTVKVTDALGNNLSRGFGWNVSKLLIVNMGDRILPAANVNLFYSFTFQLSGGTAPYTFSTISALPSGLTLSSAGVLSGTPTGSTFGFGFFVTVTDSVANFKNIQFAITVLPATPIALTISTATIGDSQVGQEFDWLLNAFGGLAPYTFDVAPGSSLPPGAEIISGSSVSPADWYPAPGYIRSRLRTPNTYSFVLRVTDSVGNQSTRPFTWRAVPIGFFYEYLPVSGVITLGAPYSQQLIPLGGTPPYTITPLNIPAGLSIDPTGFLSGIPAETSGPPPNCCLPFNVGLTDSSAVPNVFNENFGNITILSSSAVGLLMTGGNFGPFQKGNQVAITISVSGSPSATPNYAVSIVSGALPPGLVLLQKGDFNDSNNINFAAQIAGTPTVAGSYEVVLGSTDSFGNVGQRRLRIGVSNMAFVNATLATGTINQPYSQTIDVRGGTGTLTYSLTSGLLPTGLSLDPNTGLISGTPMTSAAATATILVTDSTGDSILRSFALTIYQYQITDPHVLPLATLGRSYSYTFMPSPPGAYSWTAAGLPNGLSLDPNTGVLSGTVLTTGTFTVNVSAGTAGNAVSKSFTLFINTLQSRGDLTGLPTSSLGDFVLGATVNTTLNVFGGTPPYNVSLLSGSLPPGLSVVPSETYNATTGFGRFIIAGVPTSIGPYSFRLHYTDSSGLFADRTVSMHFTKLSLATLNPDPATYLTPYGEQFQGIGGTGTYSFVLANLVGNLLPPGLNLSSSGFLSGTPTSTGTFIFTVDLTSGVDTRRFSIPLTVNATPSVAPMTLSFGPFVADLPVGKGAVVTLAPIGGAGTHTWSIIAGSLPPGLSLITDPSVTGVAAPSAVISGAPTTPGTYSIRIRVDDSTGKFAVREASVVVTRLASLGPVVIPFNRGLGTTGLLLPPRVGTFYSASLACTNGASPCTFTQLPGTFLPNGMSFSLFGVLSSGPSGPTESGNFTLNALVRDSSGNTFTTLRSFEVFPSGKPVGINGILGTPALQSATIGTPYAFSLEDLLITGQGTRPITWSVDSGSLPPGLSIAPGSISTSATLTGNPNTAGTYVFTLVATDATGRQHLILNNSITVGSLNVSPTANSLALAVSGTFYSKSLVASGGTPPVQFRPRFNSDMPVGMSLSPSGVLSGTPSTLTSYPFLVQVESVDALNNVFLKRYNLDVSPAGTVIPAFDVSPSSIAVTYILGNPAPAPVTLNINSTFSPFPYTGAATGGAWLSLSSNSGTTPSSTNAIFDFTGLAVGTYNGAISFEAVAANNSPFTVPVTLVVATSVPCTYSIRPVSASIAAGGGAGSFNVAAGTSCNWTASSNDSWINITSAGSGTANRNVAFSASANPNPSPRTGTISLQGLTFTLTQFGTSCGFSISPGSSSVSSSGGSGIVNITASASGCPWTALANDSWLSISGPSSGTGSGGVTVNVDPNVAGSRTGTLTIATQTYTANQTGANCTYSLSGAGASIAASGDVANVNITAPAGCSWTVDPGPSWISITSPVGGTGTGNGSASFSVAPTSTTSARAADVLIGGVPFNIAEAGVTCSFTISANNPFQPSFGGSSSVQLTTAGPACSWVATSNAPWVTLTPPSSGSGNATINFTVAANGGAAARSATLTVAGQNLIVNQAGTVCSYTLRSPFASVPSSATDSSVGVVAATGCAWAAVSNADWVSITGGASSGGTADVAFHVNANNTGAERTGTLTIADKTFAITQQLAACTVTLGTPSGSVGPFGGSGSFGYTTSVPGCTVNLSSNTSWLNITSSSYAGNAGTVNYSADANTFGAGRSGLIRVGDVNFALNEGASPCSYTPTISGASFSHAGGAGSIPMTFAPVACGSPAVSFNAPPGMITPGSLTLGGGLFTQFYSIGIYNSFINYIRAAQISVQGQIVYSVKQTSY